MEVVLHGSRRRWFHVAALLHRPDHFVDRRSVGGCKDQKNSLFDETEQVSAGLVAKGNGVCMTPRFPLLLSPSFVSMIGISS